MSESKPTPLVNELWFNAEPRPYRCTCGNGSAPFTMHSTVEPCRPLTEQEQGYKVERR